VAEQTILACKGSLKAVGSRFYKLPDAIHIRALRYRSKAGTQPWLATVNSQESALSIYAEKSRTIDLGEYRVRWYILPKAVDHRGRKHESEYDTAKCYNNISAHTAVLFQEELYDLEMDQQH
jgi:hypothetical protein